MRGASVRRDASGDERRGPKSDCVVQRRSSNEEHPSMQRNQPAAANAPVDLTVATSDRDELLRVMRRTAEQARRARRRSSSASH